MEQRPKRAGNDTAIEGCRSSDLLSLVILLVAHGVTQGIDTIFVHTGVEIVEVDAHFVQGVGDKASIRRGVPRTGR